MQLLKSIWKDFWKDRVSNWLLGVGLGLYGLLGLIIWWLTGWLPRGKSVMPPEFPLFYSLPRGTEQLAMNQDLWRGLAALGILLIIDLGLAVVLYRKYKILAYSVLWAAILSVGMWGFTILRIYLLVK